MALFCSVCLIKAEEIDIVHADESVSQAIEEVVRSHDDNLANIRVASEIDK